MESGTFRKFGNVFDCSINTLPSSFQGCSRSTYSRVCYDLASHGFVVAAVEHRDGSAAASFYQDEQGERRWVAHRPVAPDENEYQVRNKQCHFRAAEVKGVE